MKIEVMEKIIKAEQMAEKMEKVIAQIAGTGGVYGTISSLLKDVICDEIGEDSIQNVSVFFTTEEQRKMTNECECKLTQKEIEKIYKDVIRCMRITNDALRKELDDEKHKIGSLRLAVDRLLQ